MTVHAEVAIVLGSIPAFSDTVESEGRRKSSVEYSTYLHFKKSEKSPVNIQPLGSGNASEPDPGLYLYRTFQCQELIIFDILSENMYRVTKKEKSFSNYLKYKSFCLYRTDVPVQIRNTNDKYHSNLASRVS
jgi:hypothetical protein